MPPANNIGISAASNMVTSTVGVQTSCPNSPTYVNLYGKLEDEDDICPKHFTDIHKCKLEDNFSRKQKPDDIQLQIIAMECNLLYKDVRDWFRKRRIKWIEELVRNESNSQTNSQKSTHHNSNTLSNYAASSNDSNNNNTIQKKQKHTNALDHKYNKNILVHNNTLSHHDVTTT